MKRQTTVKDVQEYKILEEEYWRGYKWPGS